MARQRSWIRQFETRTVLFAGLGGLLLLMASAGGYSLRIVRDLRLANASIRQRFLVRNQLLEKIRASILISGTYARDFLLVPERAVDDEQRLRLLAAQKDTEDAVTAYSGILEDSEIAPFADLRSEIHAYYKLLDLITEWKTPEKRRSGYQYLFKELSRRRTSMLEIADRISRLNERELTLGDQRSSEAFDRFRFSLAVGIAIALSAGALLAGLTFSRIFALDRQGARARTELHELSARLVRAQEEERKTISRELHDEVGQKLSALLVETGNTAALLPPADQQLRSHVDGIRVLAEDCVRVIRNLALLLRPSMLDDLGLVPALEWQARDTARRTGMRVRVSAEEAADQLPDEWKTCIYRVVQEALNNVAKHAGARQVDIEVAAGEEKVVVKVTDDGRGFDAAHVRGLGLLGMQERVTHLGGRFHVDSAPGRGATVEVQLPVDGRA